MVWAVICAWVVLGFDAAHEVGDMEKRISNFRFEYSRGRQRVKQNQRERGVRGEVGGSRRGERRTGRQTDRDGEKS